MTAVYPDRREELDAYAEDIVDISNFYGLTRNINF
jgi:hypothetical protein